MVGGVSIFIVAAEKRSLPHSPVPLSSLLVLKRVECVPRRLIGCRINPSDAERTETNRAARPCFS